MGDFLATPFMMIMYICIYIISFLNGKSYALIEVEFEEDDEDEQ